MIKEKQLWLLGHWLTLWPTVVPIGGLLSPVQAGAPQCVSKAGI